MKIEHIILYVPGDTKNVWPQNSSLGTMNMSMHI